MIEYDEAREEARLNNIDIFNLAQPADAVDLSVDFGHDLPAYIYSSGRMPYVRKGGPKKRHREYKINEFVDSTRAIIGSS